MGVIYVARFAGSICFFHCDPTAGAVGYGYIVRWRGLVPAYCVLLLNLWMDLRQDFHNDQEAEGAGLLDACGKLHVGGRARSQRRSQCNRAVG